MQIYEVGEMANARRADDLRAFEKAQRCGLTLRIETSSALTPDAATQRGFFHNLRRRFAHVLMTERPFAGQSR
jgi:hypothetical protein